MKTSKQNKVVNLIEFIEKKADSIFNKVAETSGDVALMEQLNDLCAACSAVVTAHDEDDDLLDKIVATANEFDQSDDPKLQKAAALLDDLLLFKGAVFTKNSSDDELAKLRSEYSSKERERDYVDTKKKSDRDNQVEEVSKAFADQVKQFRPCETSLSTRYDPDYPGVPLIRISDNVYQSSLTGKIYDYYKGYTTNKGNKVPGVSVDRQIPDWSFDQPSGFMFDTREGRMSRFASVKNAEDDNKKKSLGPWYDDKRQELSKEYDLSNISDLELGQMFTGKIKNPNKYIEVVNFIHDNKNLDFKEITKKISSILSSSELKLLLSNHLPELDKMFSDSTNGETYYEYLDRLDKKYKDVPIDHYIANFVSEPNEKAWDDLYGKISKYTEAEIDDLIDSEYLHLNLYDIKIEANDLKKMISDAKRAEQEDQEKHEYEIFEEESNKEDQKKK